MKKAWLIVTAMAVLGLWAGSASADDLWQTDMKKASEMAKASDRYILLNFTGSDWCGWCMKLDAEVFSQKEFKEYAENNLVCVKLDFPRRIALPAEVKKQNEELAKKYAVRGFPTIVVLSPSGETAGTTGYQPGGAAQYVRHLQAIIKEHRAKKSSGKNN